MDRLDRKKKGKKDTKMARIKRTRIQERRGKGGAIQQMKKIQQMRNKERKSSQIEKRKKGK